MLYHYYVNDHEQDNGDHEVHRDGCGYLPLIHSKTYLGMFQDAVVAVEQALKHFDQVNGCAFCSPEANTD